MIQWYSKSYNRDEVYSDKTYNEIQEAFSAAMIQFAVQHKGLSLYSQKTPDGGRVLYMSIPIQLESSFAQLLERRFSIVKCSKPAREGLIPLVVDDAFNVFEHPND